jgi:hypothetical protein
VTTFMLSRELYHHSSTPPASQATSKRKNEKEAQNAPRIEFCGVAFGAGAHVSVASSDGSLVPFLLRPHASCSENPDTPLTPMALLMLRPESQASTGEQYCCGAHVGTVVNIAEVRRKIQQCSTVTNKSALNH